MKYLFPLFLLLCSCSKESDELPDEITTPEVVFVKTLGGSNNDIGYSITKTNDNGYAILGYTDSPDGDITTKNTTDSDFLLLKYDINDTLEWQQTYGGSSDDRGNKIIQTSDNGYAILGYSSSNDLDVSVNNGADDFWIVKLNEQGNILWESSFGFAGSDSGTSLIETSDNGFLLVGELDITASGGLGNANAAKKHAGGDFWAIKLDRLGNFEWSRFYGGSFTETAQDVVETSDGYIISGSSDSLDIDINNNYGGYDIWIVKIDFSGNLIWQRNFGGSSIDEAYQITTTSSGDFLIIGNTLSVDENVNRNNGLSDLWMVKISTEGDLIWEKTFGGTSFDVGRAISTTADGGFLVAGSSRSEDGDFVNKGQNDAWVLKISDEGTLQWQKFIGGSEVDFLYDIVELNNGEIIAIGETTSNDIEIPDNNGFSDVLTIKIK